MALIFNTDIELASGITVANAYGRVAVADTSAGKTLQQLVEIYTSEQAFLDGKSQIEMPGLQNAIETPYDRATDGTDILALAHANLQTALADAGYTTTISL
jgi:hypothetical protein